MANLGLMAYLENRFWSTIVKGVMFTSNLLSKWPFSKEFIFKGVMHNLIY